MNRATMIDRPLKVASVSNEVIQRITARTCQLQGMPEVHYGLLSASDRATYERGAYNVLAALESLGFIVIAPAELSPVLPHDREAP